MFFIIPNPKSNAIEASRFSIKPKQGSYYLYIHRNTLTTQFGEVSVKQVLIYPKSEAQLPQWDYGALDAL